MNKTEEGRRREKERTKKAGQGTEGSKVMRDRNRKREQDWKGEMTTIIT